MKKMTKLIAAAAAMTVAMSASAEVKTTSFTDSFSDVEGNGPGVLTLSQFDTSLGKLKSVTFELTDNLSGFVRFGNNGKNGSLPADFTASLTGTLHTDYGDINSVYTKAVTLAAGVYQSYDLGTISQSYSHTFSSDAELMMFTHTPLLINISGEVTPVLTGPGNSYLYSEGTIDAYAKVTYTFETAPVPEPETYAMLLAGLGLVGAIARRRKSA